MLVRFVIVVAAFAWLTRAVSGDDTQLPRKVFDTFKEALRDGDANSAISLISQNTISAQEQLRRWSLELSRDELEKLGEMEVGNILSFRQAYSKTKLEQSTGKQLLQESLAKPTTTKFFAALSVADVKIDDKIAIAVVRAGPKGSREVNLQFRKEKNGWKIDLDHFGKQSQSWYGPAREKSGLSKIDFAMQLLKKQFGAEKVSAKIVDGPRE